MCQVSSSRLPILCRSEDKHSMIFIRFGRFRCVQLESEAINVKTPEECEKCSVNIFQAMFLLGMKVFRIMNGDKKLYIG